MFPLAVGNGKEVYERSQTGRPPAAPSATMPATPRHPGARTVDDRRPRSEGEPARRRRAALCASWSAGAAISVLFAPISFAVAAGSIAWIHAAPNGGQGKTTLLRTLAGLSAPAAGTRLAWAGAPAIAPRPLYLAHANALKEDLTVGESLRFLLHLGGHHVDSGDVDAALERFGMASRKDAFVRTLSQGQRRRVRPRPPGGASASRSRGCSTSPSTPSTPPASICSPASSPSTRGVAARSSSPATCRCRSTRRRRLSSSFVSPPLHESPGRPEANTAAHDARPGEA